MNNSLLLETQNLEVFINDKTVCKGLDFKIHHGEHWGIIGVNGIGKTTLLHTLAGLREPAGGSIFLQGENLKNISRRKIAQSIGVLLQNDTQSFPGTVLETALIGRHPFLRPWQWETREDVELAQRALELVDLNSMDSRMINTLSGGENRRLSLATLITQNPLLQLLDEPTNHLDMHHQISILEMLAKQTDAKNQSTIMILHDLNLAQRFCDHIMLLFGEGETLTGPAAEVLTTDSLSRLFNHPTIKIDSPNGPVFLPA